MSRLESMTPMDEKIPREVKPFYIPPSLVFRQAYSLLFFGYATGWRKLLPWTIKATKTLHIAAGAVGMGCIGFPNHPVWEMTYACNLRCKHCHASSSQPSQDELTTREAKGLLREIARVDQFRMMVFSGGEPMVREDVFELCEYCKRLGFPVVIATNGTLVTTEVARRLARCGVVCLAVSLDSTKAEVHDHIRSTPGAFDLAIRGIRACREAGMALQINMTAMEYNMSEIPELLDLASRYNASIVLMYQLIPIGRGSVIKDKALSAEHNRKLLEAVAEAQKHAIPIIEPVGGPQYWAMLMARKRGTNHTPLWDELGLKMARAAFRGCVAGSGLCYIKPNGDVWACPFLPLSAGNVRERSFVDIWDDSPLFRELRDRNLLKGRCGECEYNWLCGGCRGRSFAFYGDHLAEDPSCFLNSKSTELQFSESLKPLAPCRGGLKADMREERG